MTLSAIQARPSEKGFTLVELAIVMIIIGLLIGGILKGQELINNARVSSSVSQIKAVEAAVNTFKDKYAAYPGDITNASTRLPSCTAVVCATAGDGDTLIEVTGDNVGGTPANTEGGRAFIHLAAAGVLSSSGVDPSIGAWASGTALPDLNLGGKIFMGYNSAATGTTGLTAGGNLGGHYLAVGASGAVTMAAPNVTLKSSSAANIDRKLDDGLPNVGSVQASGSVGATAANCAAGNTAADVYNEGLDGASCGLFVRILN